MNIGPAKRVRGDGLRRLQPAKHDLNFEFNSHYASAIPNKKKKGANKGKKGRKGGFQDEGPIVYEEVSEEDVTEVEFVHIQDFTCRDVKSLIAPENVLTLEDDIKNGRDDEYWSDSKYNDYVTCSNIMELANDNAISERVINAWATKLQETTKEDGPKVLIFTVYLWETAVSNKITKILSQTDPKIKWKRKVEWISDAPQQDPQTLDCGIIVSILMERFLNGEDPLKKVEKKNCWEYRARMINEFMVQHTKDKIDRKMLVNI